jgi:hypothetical protein
MLAQSPGQTPPQPTLKVGDMAPDFTLAGTDGKMHKLSSYRGKSAVVIAWFPKAFTSGCTVECKSLADNGDKIQKYEVVYFMASTDTIDENTKFAKATSVTLPGRAGGEAHRGREEGSRLPDAVGSHDGDGAGVRRRHRRSQDGEPLDVLRRQVRQDCGDRDCGPSSHVC